MKLHRIRDNETLVDKHKVRSKGTGSLKFSYTQPKVGVRVGYEDSE